MSYCSLVLEDQLSELMNNYSIVQRLVEENKLKQMAIDKATGLVQTLSDEISMLREQLLQSSRRYQRFKEELAVYKQLHPKWTAELRYKDRVIAELHALIRSQEKYKIDNLYAGTRHKADNHYQLTFTEDGFGKRRMFTEGSNGRADDHRRLRYSPYEKNVEKVKESLLWLREVVRSSDDEAKDSRNSQYRQYSKRLQSSNNKHSQSKSTHCYQPSGSNEKVQACRTLTKTPKYARYGGRDSRS